jgi:hypothetical protein
LRVMVFFVLLLVAACSEPPPPPTYEQPDSGEALRAVQAGLKADHIDQPEKTVRLNREVRTYSEYWTQSNSEVARGNNEGYARMYSDLIGIEKLKCAWGPFQDDDVSDNARIRLHDAPKGAYRCTFIFSYKPDPVLGQLMVSEGEGSFFKDGDKFVYFGTYHHPY